MTQSSLYHGLSYLQHDKEQVEIEAQRKLLVQGGDIFMATQATFQFQTEDFKNQKAIKPKNLFRVGQKLKRNIENLSAKCSSPISPFEDETDLFLINLEKGKKCSIYQDSARVHAQTHTTGFKKSVLLNVEKPLYVSKSSGQEKEGKEKYRKTLLKQQEIADRNDLNNWDYCNPKNLEDQLPQPYRFIDRLLNDTIFKQVNLQIFEIEKTYKSDLNYEGNLAEMPPQGSFELNGISAMNSCVKNKQNQIIAGDKSGNIFILDLNKKTQICKKDVTPSKRIINISSMAIPFGEVQLTTISIISRSDPSVYIYRFLSGDNKLYHHYTIKIPASAQESATNGALDGQKYANPLPFRAQVSINGDFVSVSTYNGDVHIFQIPDPPSIPKADVLADDPSNQVYGQQYLTSPKKSPYAMQKAIGSLLEMKPQDLDKPLHSILFQGIKIELNYKELIAKLNKEQFESLNPELVQQQLLEQQLLLQNQAKEKKEVKKDAKKGGKEQQQAADKEQEEKKQQEIEAARKKEVLYNDVVQIPEYKVSSSGQDISDEIPAPKFLPFCSFLKTNVVLPDSHRLFAKQISFELVTGFLITWKGSKTFELHSLRPPLKEYLVSVLYDSLQKEEQLPSGSETNSVAIKSEKSGSNKPSSQQKPPPPLPPPTQAQLRAQLPPLKPKMTQSFNLIYPITCLNINESESFAGFGLKDGTIILWDLHFQVQKYALDRHVQEVTCLRFLENWRLVSGSKDGSVHLHDIEKGKMMMKRTNVFMEKRKNEIIDISVSDSGLAFVLDSLKNLRVYDLWHGQKIAKLQASSRIEEKRKTWTLFPGYVVDAQRDQLCILTDIHEDFTEEEAKSINSCDETEKPLKQRQIEDVKVKKLDKNTNISIIRVYDILINIFPGLASVSRRGLERDKLINLFGHLSLENLNDPSFEVPLIGPPKNTLNQLPVEISKGGKRDSKSYLPSILKNKSRDSSFNDSSANLTDRAINKAADTNTQKPTNKVVNTLPKGNVIASQQQVKLKSVSSFESEPDLNSSYRTQLTQATHIKTANQPQHGKQARLTKEVLHPERFLLEKIKIPGQILKDPSSDTIDLCRRRFEEKEQRETKIVSDLTKLAQELEKNEEKRIKQLKEKQLRTNSASKTNSAFQRSSKPISNKTSYN